MAVTRSGHRTFCRRFPHFPVVFPLLAIAVGLFSGCGGLAARGKNAQGVRLFQHAQYEEALSQFQNAANRDPDNADACYNMGAVLQRLGTINNDPGQLAQAENYFNQCLDRDENHQACNRALAVLLVQTERKDAAFRLLRGWATRQPGLADPRIELARLHEEFGDRAAAKERLLEALAIDHENPRALAALGHLREASGEYAQALSDYQQSLWQNRYQNGVAARVAALAGAAGPSPVLTAPNGATRMVNAATPPRR